MTFPPGTRAVCTPEGINSLPPTSGRKAISRCDRGNIQRAPAGSAINRGGSRPIRSCAKQLRGYKVGGGESPATAWPNWSGVRRGHVPGSPQPAPSVRRQRVSLSRASGVFAQARGEPKKKKKKKKKKKGPHPATDSAALRKAGLKPRIPNWTSAAFIRLIVVHRHKKTSFSR